MDNLRQRFSTIDRLAAPDLWPEVTRRSFAAAPTAVTRPATAWRGAQPRSALSPTVVMLLLTAVAVLLLGAVVVGSWLDDQRSVVAPTGTPVTTLTTGPTASARPSPTAEPTLTAEPTPTLLPSATAEACAGTERPTEMRVTNVDIPTYTSGVFFAACQFWLSWNSNGAGLTALDPVTNELGVEIVPDDPVPPGQPLRGVILSEPFVDGDDLWVVAGPAMLSQGYRASVVRIDARQQRIGDSFELPEAYQSASVVVDAERIFVGSLDGSLDSRAGVLVLDKRSGEVLTTLETSMRLIGIDDGWLWGYARLAGTDECCRMARLNVDSGAVETVWPSVALVYEFTDDYLYLFEGEPGPADLVQLSLADGSVVRQIELPGTDLWLAAEGEHIWVLPYVFPEPPAFPTGNEILRLDPQTGAIAQRLDYESNNPLDLHVAGGSLWTMDQDHNLVRIELP